MMLEQGSLYADEEGRYCIRHTRSLVPKHCHRYSNLHTLLYNKAMRELEERTCISATYTLVLPRELLEGH